MELILDGPELGDSTLVGHKFARQDVMRRAGLPVPAFFCLTGAAVQASVPAVTGFPGDDAGSGYAATPPASVLSQAVPQAFARSRTRPM